MTMLAYGVLLILPTTYSMYCKAIMMTTSLTPIKGTGTTLWLYLGENNPLEAPFSDTDWIKIAKVKELQPGEMTAESQDDTYLDDENSNWKITTQGEKSAGEASITLAWLPNESGQKEIIRWFDKGSVRYYRIRFPNGAVDIYQGWVSALGKTVTAKEMITRTIKITNNGRPTLAEILPNPPVIIETVTQLTEEEE